MDSVRPSSKRKAHKFQRSSLSERRNVWHEEEAITLLKETEYLVGELTKGGVLFPAREKYHREIVRASAAKDWDGYVDALAAYTRGAKRALERARGGFFFF